MSRPKTGPTAPKATVVAVLEAIVARRERGDSTRIPMLAAEIGCSRSAVWRQLAVLLGMGLVRGHAIPGTRAQSWTLSPMGRHIMDLPWHRWPAYMEE